MRRASTPDADSRGAGSVAVTPGILVTFGAVYASDHIKGLGLGSFIFWAVVATGVIACAVAIGVARKNARVRREASVVLTNAARWHGQGSDLTLLFGSEAYANRVAQAVGQRG